MKCQCKQATLSSTQWLLRTCSPMTRWIRNFKIKWDFDMCLEWSIWFQEGCRKHLVLCPFFLSTLPPKSDQQSKLCHMQVSILFKGWHYTQSVNAKVQQVEIMFLVAQFPQHFTLNSFTKLFSYQTKWALDLNEDKVISYSIQSQVYQKWSQSGWNHMLHR